MKTIISLLTLVCIVSLGHAQRDRNRGQENNIRHRPIQISLIPPLSTNGFRSGRMINHFSFNFIGGYSGGLKGVEFGSAFNIIKFHAYGMQFAGALNVVGGRTHGGQFSGGMNLAAGGFRGVQMAGAINVAGNRVKDQEVGEAKPPTETKGKPETKGAQIAGALNIALGDFYGVQVSGGVNIANRVHGFQIGVINLANSVEDGVPIGIISLVKNGYHRIEGGVSESLLGYASLKLGVPRFYNIFSAGIQANFTEPTFAVGYGIGTKFRHGKRIGYNIDLVSYRLFADQNDWNELNQLNRLSFNLSLHSSKRFAIYGGLAANVFVTTDKERSITPVALFDQIYQKTRVQIYPGLQVGIRM